MEETPSTKPCGKCLECGAPTYPIMVVSGGHWNHHQLLEYAPVDAKAGWLRNRFPVKGHLGAELCEQCGRVGFRARPLDKQPE